MTCGILANRRFNLDYAELNMKYTNAARMWAVARNISAFVYAVPLALIAAAELIVKNSLFSLFNAVVFVIKTTVWAVSKVIDVVRSCFGAVKKSAGGRVQPVNESARGGVQLINTQFTADDLITFRSALRLATSPDNRTEVFLEQFLYTLWFDQATQTVNVQDLNREGQPTLSLQIAEGGQVLSIKIDGIAQAIFPPEFEACMYPCFMKSLEVSSTYLKVDDEIRIRVIRRGLCEIAEYHLDQLGRALQVGNRAPSLHVQFLTNSLDRDEGIDAGGPRRDYFDDLMRSLLLNKGELRFVTPPQTALCMPVTTDPYQNHRVPDITAIERPLFQKLGAAMMLSYQSEGALLVGRRFHDWLFRAAFSLTAAEVDTPFANLAPQTLLKMSKEILLAGQASVRVVDLLENAHLNEDQWAEAAEIAKMADGWPDDFEFAPGNARHEQLVLDGLRTVLFSEVGRYLAPIHAIAKGITDTRRRWGIMNERIRWDTFSDRIQGRIDGAAIANSLRINEGENITPLIRQKVQWIQEWLRDPATSQDDIREFVKFATGSSSLGLGAHIRVSCQMGQSIPAAVGHSCFSTIDLSPQHCAYGRYNDNTKENFIRALRELSLTQAGNYFMG